MSKSSLITRNWAGGVSVDGKIGTDSSFKKSRSINHRKRVSSIELHRRFVKESGTTVNTPVYAGVRTPDSSVYFMGDTKVYRRAADVMGSAGVYSLVTSDVTNVKSGVYNRDRKKLYMPGDRSIHAIDYSATQLFKNLVDNSSFEHSTTPLQFWTATAGTITSDTTQFYEGTKSMKLVYSAAGSLAYADLSTPLDTSKTYRLQARVKGTAGHIVTLAGGTFESSNFVLTGGWDLIATTYTPAGANFKRIEIRQKTAASTIYIDTVMLTEGSAVQSYFDGNYVDSGSSTYRWDGDVFLSPSTRQVSNTDPQFVPSLVSKILDQNVVNTGSLAYTLPTSISESAVNKLAFKPDIEPYVRVAFYVIAKGTGNIIVTLHDQANNIVAQATLPAASVTANAVNTIDFASQIRLSANPNPYEYHVHLTTASGSGTTVRTATANDLSKADFQSYADALVAGVYHPAGEFLQYNVFGNDNYVAVWEAITDAPTKTEFDPHRLKLPSEYRVLEFTEYKEYYVISAYKSVSSDYGSNDAGAGSTEGLLGFWDGASRGFAWFVKIEGGAFESPFTYNGFIYGYVNGVLHVTSGDIPIPVYEIPGLIDFKSSKGHTDDVYLQAPYKAMCVTGNILQMGYPMRTANESITPGLYSFGRKTKDYAESIAFDHIPSHDQTVIRYNSSDQPVSGITYLGRFGKNTFMAWQSADGSGNRTYGIDVLNNTNPVYSSGTLSYLDIDNKATYKKKEAVEAIATYTKLPGNSTIKMFYAINGGEITYGDASELEHDTENQQFKLKIPKEYRVIEYGIELIASTDLPVAQSPVVDSTTIIIETNASEGL